MVVVVVVEVEVLVEVVVVLVVLAFCGCPVPQRHTKTTVFAEKTNIYFGSISGNTCFCLRVKGTHR